MKDIKFFVSRSEYLERGLLSIIAVIFLFLKESSTNEVRRKLKNEPKI
ncbi:hypothetical protein J4470_02675 [Candidatus Woesearchaeota archaeon]|nr:hypothetical protein [Candidatus Woesearchaeota archaeon]